MKNLLAVLMVLGVSYLGAQDLKQMGVYKKVLPSVGTLQAKNNDGNLFVAGRFVALNEGPVIAPVAGDAESGFVWFSDVGGFEVSGFVGEHKRTDLVKEVPHTMSFFESLREEIGSWTGAVPDLSTSWLGISCFVRNPVRYMLVPEKNYAHELGFRTGDWVLSIDGIRSNTLQDLKIALEFPLGKTVSLFVKRSDISYNLDVDVSGKLPWQ